jgi:hypothetical protein
MNAKPPVVWWLCTVLFCVPAQAQHAGDMLIASAANGGGALVISYSFSNKVVVSESFSGGGTTLYSATDPGFDLVATDDPGASLYVLDSGVTVRVELTAIASGASMKIGAVTLDAAGESALLGSAPNIHVHPEWRLTLPTGVFGDYPISFRLTTTAPGYSQSVIYTATVTNLAPAPTATPTTTATTLASPTASPTPTATVAATPQSSCPPTPVSGCRNPTQTDKALLLLKGGADPAKHTLLWKWLKGQATQLAELGDPTLATVYRLCVYDESAGVARRVLQALIPPAGSCDGAPCWKAIRGGYKYKDPNGSAAGVRNVLLKSGESGKAKIIVKGKGGGLDMPALPLDQDPAVRVQLSNGSLCWEAVYPGGAMRSDDRQFKDRPVAVAVAAAGSRRWCRRRGRCLAAGWGERGRCGRVARRRRRGRFRRRSIRRRVG